MALHPSVKVVKEFTYRGDLKRWSNRYHFETPGPGTDGQYEHMAGQIRDREKLVLPPSVSIKEQVFYAAGSDIPVHTTESDVAGSFASALDWVQGPGDSAALVRFSTASRTVKNHPLYLFNYYHAPALEGDDLDVLLGAYKAALEVYGQYWIDGVEYDPAGFGSKTHRCGPNGDVATSRFVEPMVTHRDFPR